jgi:putative acetyltransferase
MRIEIRPEQEPDREAVRLLNTLAFGQPAEADLVDALRGSVQPLVSLVALLDRRVVGHILFSPVTVGDGEEQKAAMALGPMAVLPGFQGQGIGSRLVREGLARCRQLGHGVVFVLGHPAFYPRFGFAPAAPLGLRWEHDVPEEAFMVAALEEGALDRYQGLVRYHPAFDGV